MLKIILSICFVALVSASTRSFRIPFGRPIGHFEKDELHIAPNYTFVVRVTGIQIETENGTTYRVTKTCGGSIIRLDIVLTAAHCVDGFQPESLKIEAGLYNTAVSLSSTQTSRAKSYEMHDGYYLEPYVTNDIALIFLETPFTKTSFVAPIELPTKNYEDNAIVTILGWGLDENGSSPEWLRMAKMAILSHRSCQLFTYALVSSKMLCAINQGKATICKGDSGGPLVYNNTLIGVASYVMDTIELDDNKITCDTALPSVFVNVFLYVGWIRKIITDHQS